MAKIEKGKWYICGSEILDTTGVIAIHRDIKYYCCEDGYLCVDGKRVCVGTTNQSFKSVEAPAMACVGKIPHISNSKKTDKLTEFEKELTKMAKCYSEVLIALARKQIASEIDKDLMQLKYTDLLTNRGMEYDKAVTFSVAYCKGIEDTLKAIK